MIENDRPISLNDKLKTLKENILNHENDVTENMTRFYGDKPKFIVFLSASDGKTRAHVRNGVGNTLENAWRNAVNQLKKMVKQQKMQPKWVKVDLVQDIQTFTYPDFINHVTSIKRNYFREGIAFDPIFNLAFLEQEVNGNVFFHGLKEKKRAQLAFKNINFYGKKHRGMKYSLKEDMIKDVYTFNTISYFHDEEKEYELLNDWLNNGRRRVDNINRNFLYDLIDRASKFLASQVYDTGKFRYGYFPCFDKEIDHYNILRHASTTYSMVEAYEVTKDLDLKLAIESALHYLVNEGMEVVTGEDGVKRAFVIERVANDEIKLGANAHAILALSKYTTVTGNDKYKEEMNQLAEGILYFQQEKDGSFVHVLQYPDLSVKDVYRTIYYDGEAAFALMRLYEIDENDKWLQATERAFDYFIEAKHWRHGDHWLSYCSNELIKYKQEKKYVEFNLKNAGRRLDFCLTRETTFPTLLELIMASYNMIEKLKKDNMHLDLVEAFDQEKLMRAIEHRVDHQLNGWFCPEVAMYFKNPANILWSFFIRHHSFRVRIDDIEHNISGYCSYYHNIAE